MLPINATDTGLEVLLQRATKLGVSGDRFSRARNAVTKQWNSMNGLLIVSLNCAVYGFVGKTSHQSVNSEHSPHVVFIGGAIQLWIPKLTANEIRRI